MKGRARCPSFADRDMTSPRGAADPQAVFCESIAAVITCRLPNGGKIMAVATVLRTPVVITGVIAVHNDNGIIFT